MKPCWIVTGLLLAGVPALGSEGGVPEWQNPEVFERGQEPGHAPLMSFESIEEALQHRPKSAGSNLMLNGSWSFDWAVSPVEAPSGFEDPAFDVSEWSSIEVPSNWQMQGFGHPMFRNIAHPFPSEPPNVPSHYNPVGSYRRDFDLPEDWEGRRLLLHFEGVKSAAYFWLNGRELGYNQGGMEPAEFDVSDHVRSGRNVLAVQVLRYSDGTYLEDQDMWRLSGIYRDVYLRATPRVHIRDLYVVTDLDEGYRDAVLDIQAEITNQSGAPIDGYRLRAKLFLEGDTVFDDPVMSQPFALPVGDSTTVKLSQEVVAPALWSAEAPSLYSLVAELLDSQDNVVEIVSTRTGFREIEIEGQALLVNGRAIKLNAVNSHVHHPVAGRAMDVETMRRDLVLMKQFNINAVRTSHYPPNVEYLDLADELGVYVIDETNNEAHATIHLSGAPEWREAYVDRARKMVLRDRNHPSIVMWSAGNESGSGDNICELISECNRRDPSRPAWMYGGNNDYFPGNEPLDCEDVIGPRYPTPFELRTRIAPVSASVDPRPSFMDEYLAATGNGIGGLDEYWEVIRSCRRCIGGAVWDWVSPGVTWPWRVTPDGAPQGNHGALMGRSRLTDGQFGRALELSGHDEWLELYRSPGLDVTGNQITLELWVQPGTWRESGPLLTKGDHQFGLAQVDVGTLEFYIHDGERVSVEAPVPADWEGQWHHVAGTYDGRELVLWMDGERVGSIEHAGTIDHNPFPVNVGRNAALHGQEHPGELANGLFDRVRIYDRALRADELGSETPGLQEGALLWLDFESVEQLGEFYSLGIGGRSYGMIWPDRSVQPELWQLKKSAQPVIIEALDPSSGRVRITNAHHFTDLAELEAVWEVTGNGVLEQEGRLDLALAPGRSIDVAVPFDQPSSGPGKEYRLRLSFRLRQETSWAARGHEVAWEEFDLPVESEAVPRLDLEAMAPLGLEEGETRVTIRGTDFTWEIDKITGELDSLTYRGEELLRRGPRLSVWRPPLANEIDGWSTWRGKLRTARDGMGAGVANGWKALGLDRLEQHIDAVEVQRHSPAEILIRIRGYALSSAVPSTEFASGFALTYEYRFLGSGDLLLSLAGMPQGVMPEWLPRIGMEMMLSPELETVSWYGRGPQETYPDRRTGARFGVYSSTVKKAYESYLIPQEYGNRSDTRWISLQGESGIGLFASGDTDLEASARHFSTENLSRAIYTPQLTPQDGITLNLDHRMSGVGGTAVSVLSQYQVRPEPWKYTVRLRPFTIGEEEPQRLFLERPPK